ncbi:hypothetical protein L2E82_36626 [Cichorium intybus]|uniref:Uncharacterized protein n=1 Tax=Cichorium intybus TaxID=13427 RepID=A0ACB9ACB4_CICIN|nr:hypothetical protein L2E82_36626 [Cichorium intybus]
MYSIYKVSPLVCFLSLSAPRVYNIKVGMHVQLSTVMKDRLRVLVENFHLVSEDGPLLPTHVGFLLGGECVPVMLGNFLKGNVPREILMSDDEVVSMEVGLLGGHTNEDEDVGGDAEGVSVNVWSGKTCLYGFDDDVYLAALYDDEGVGLSNRLSRYGDVEGVEYENHDLRYEVDAVVYLVDAYDRERFAESKNELDALLSDESLANVPFLILGHKIDLNYAASEDELRYHMGLTGLTTGKGKVNLENSGVRPLEVFMCSIVRKMGYGDGFKWVSQYIK